MGELSKRKYHAFISYSHADKLIVDRVHTWFRDRLEFRVWYDGAKLSAGSEIVSSLPNAIKDCQSVIIVFSENSVESGWVRQEYNTAIAQRAKFQDFKIIPIRIGDCKIPDFLETTKWINLPEGNLGLDAAYELLTSFYHDDWQPNFNQVRDIYVIRTWNAKDASLANCVCNHLVQTHEFRLIGDAENQRTFDEQRIASIMSGCHAVVAILSDRGGGETSSYFFKEIKVAQDKGIPCIIVAEPAVRVPAELEKTVVRMGVSKTNSEPVELEAITDRLNEQWQQPIQPRTIFFASNFDYPEKVRAIRDIIQRVSNLPCVIGDDIREGEVQKEIVRRIAQSYIMIADLSEPNLNTCIEVGIARGAIAQGANLKFHLIAREPRHKPPFMFQDQQVHYYADDFELLGVVHRLIYPYRQRVLNYEL